MPFKTCVKSLLQQIPASQIPEYIKMIQGKGYLLEPAGFFFSFYILFRTTKLFGKVGAGFSIQVFLK